MKTGKPRAVGLPRVHRIAAEWLRRNARGRAQARPKGQILRGLGALGLRVASREFDTLMGQMVLGGMAVGSCGKGFFWMVAREDYALARHYVTTRFRPMRARADAIAAQERRRFPAALPLMEHAALRRAETMAGHGRRRSPQRAQRTQRTAKAR